MALTANDVLVRVRDALFDQTGVRWPDEELLRWIADAQALIVKYVPDAAAVTTNVNLVPGTLQTLTPTASRLLRVLRNQGTDNSEAGSAITQTTRKALDAIRPEWHTEVGTGEIQHWVYEPEVSRRNFYVYPGPSETRFVQVVIARKCPTTLNPGDVLYVEDDWINAMFDWTMHRALEKQSDFGSGMGRSQSHAQAFAAAVGMEYTARGLVNPARDIPGEVIRNG